MGVWLGTGKHKNAAGLLVFEITSSLTELLDPLLLTLTIVRAYFLLINDRQNRFRMSFVKLGLLLVIFAAKVY